MSATGEMAALVVNSIEDGRAAVVKANTATKLTVLACVLAIAIDYAVVMPSIWLYLRSFDPAVSEYMMGLATGAFALSSFLLQYPVGVWLDRRSSKEVLVCGECHLASSTWLF